MENVASVEDKTEQIESMNGSEILVSPQMEITVCQELSENHSDVKVLRRTYINAGAERKIGTMKSVVR